MPPKGDKKQKPTAGQFDDASDDDDVNIAPVIEEWRAEATQHTAERAATSAANLYQVAPSAAALPRPALEQTAILAPRPAPPEQPQPNLALMAAIRNEQQQIASTLHQQQEERERQRRLAAIQVAAAATAPQYILATAAPTYTLTPAAAAAVVRQSQQQTNLAVLTAAGQHQALAAAETRAAVAAAQQSLLMSQTAQAERLRLLAPSAPDETPTSPTVTPKASRLEQAPASKGAKKANSCSTGKVKNKNRKKVRGDKDVEEKSAEQQATSRVQLEPAVVDRRQARSLRKQEAVEDSHNTWRSSVLCAARFVSLELQYGFWPSPHSAYGNLGKQPSRSDPDGLQPSPLERDERDEVKHMAHMLRIGTTMEHLIVEQLLPAMDAQATNGREQGDVARPGGIDTRKNPSNNGNHPSNLGIFDEEDNGELPRPFLGTLLLLRELMTQNGNQIFGEDIFDEGVADYRDSNREREARSLMAQTLATGVIVACIECNFPQERGQTLMQQFLTLVNSYDDAQDEFVDSLAADDGTIQGILPNGKRLTPMEDVARHVSWNKSREQHPLVQLSRERKRRKQFPSKFNRRPLVAVATPNACHVSILEESE